MEKPVQAQDNLEFFDKITCDGMNINPESMGFGTPFEPGGLRSANLDSGYDHGVMLPLECVSITLMTHQTRLRITSSYA